VSTDITHTWIPQDIVTAGDGAPEKPTIMQTFYPGRRHLVSGEPEALKSWLAQVACADQMLLGETVMYVDLEMTPSEILSRLRCLGLGDDIIRDKFVYLRPDGPIGFGDASRDLDELIDARRPSVTVIDSFIGILQLHGLSPKDDLDIETCYATIVDRFRRHNGAPIVLDHVVKDRDARGRWSTGSERKVGAADVHLGLQVVQQFGRGRTGAAMIATHKDRPGYLRRPYHAEFELRSDADTFAITWDLREPGKTAAAGPRPTWYMEKVSTYLEGMTIPASRNQTEKAVGGKSNYVRKAMDILTDEGYVREEDGAKGGRYLVSMKPYRQDDAA
jgi:hypothetical protein